MPARPAKHSLTLHGHRTSISLEPEFWEAFCAIAAERALPLNGLAAEIDDRRTGDEGLASAIRVFSLLDTKSSIQDKPGAMPLPPFQQEIEFADVSFSYDGKTDVLKDINLKVKPDYSKLGPEFGKDKEP